MKIRQLFVAALATLAAPSIALGASATLYKSPTCGCCSAYVDYLEARGYDIEVIHPSSMNSIKDRFGVAPVVTSCHTMRIGGYTIEGHVPADALARLLEEQPPITGISVPGMPTGVAGMGGPFRSPLEVVTLGGDSFATYFRHPEAAT